MEIAEQQRKRVGTVRPGTNRIRQLAVLVIVVVPPLSVVAAMGVLWGVAFHWLDVAVLAVAYTVPAFGTTIGFHRYFSHRSFQSGAAVKAALAILGCMTVQGPPTQWVTDHRKHHAFSDKEGGPHSPHAGHPESAWGAFTGFVYAHVGWMFSNLGMEQGREYGRDLYDDPVVRAIDRLYPLWVALTLGIPFAIGYAVGGVELGVEALVWGGLIRIFLCQHATFTRSATCSGARTTAPATSRGTTGSSPCSSSVRAGTTTTTRFRPRPATASPGGSTTPPGGSSAASRNSASSGT